jgi:phosphate transport system substrate-binding protein
MKYKYLVTALALCLLVTNVVAGEKKDFGRKHVLVVADPAARELITMVASKLDKKFLADEPKIELSTNRKALKEFCLGSGPDYPDMVAATRAMNADEFKRCQEREAGGVIQVKIGYEALVVASDKKSLDLNLDQRKLYLALANDIPDPKSDIKGKLVANPFVTWKDIDSDAQKQKISIYGPTEFSRNERSVKLLGLEGGCRTWDWIPEMKNIQRSYRLYRVICNEPRKDGVYKKADSNNDDLAKTLLSEKNSIGLMDYNSWVKSKDKLKAYSINELPPTVGTISKGLYPLSRPYYVYIKISSLKGLRGVSHIMNELLNEKALGKNGYLAEMGMVAMPEKELKREVTQASEFVVMQAPDPS